MKVAVLVPEMVVELKPELQAVHKAKLVGQDQEHRLVH